MPQPETQQTTPTPATEILDPAVHYLRRRKTALWVTVSLLALSLVVMAVGLISATRTDNVPVAGYYAGIALSFGAFLGIVGIHLLENRRPMLVAAIIFISIGVISSFFCAIVDGIIASEFIDIRPLQENMCDFYASGAGYAYDSYYTEVTCRSYEKTCKLKLRSNTCYCCYLYNCDRLHQQLVPIHFSTLYSTTPVSVQIGDPCGRLWLRMQSGRLPIGSTNYHTQYYAFTGVSSCWDVIHLHRLLWASVVLNVVSLFLGIITAALLGAYKDVQKPTLQIAPSPTPPPHILYNPTQHMLTYAGFCPSGQSLPTYPNYPIPMQHNSSYQQPATPQMIPEGGHASNSCLSEENQQQPSQAPTQPQPQGTTQEPGGYMLTPNAPVLYGSAYSPFEKPPPYAC
ncbi:transmembrane protein 255B isoform X1 [Perca flavescens]|uniref:transmembrane protein 255B isoform X1 n=1 Tax=Perca flavescens TaxID=8167 RepID=UPI00106DEC8A|nr:transmembrane protein 255B isoform X1 [Perca flavescens]XP_028440495.1 transmembrane protein 255B isoform X1 [Perca flavescens]